MFSARSLRKSTISYHVARTRARQNYSSRLLERYVTHISQIVFMHCVIFI